LSGITAIPLVTVIATIMSVEAHHARLDAGLVEGIRPDDSAVIFYMEEAGPDKRKVIVSRGVVIQVDDHSSTLKLESEFTVLPGYSAALEVPMSRVAPMSVLELARSRLVANRGSEALRSLIEVVIPEDEFVERQVLRLIEDRRRRRGDSTFSTRPSIYQDAADEDASQVSSEMAALARDWAQAWSDQRADDYLGFYSRGFLIPGGMSREGWESQRRRRISRPSFIKLSLEFEASSFIDAGRGWIRFRQSYWSNSFSDVVTKRLELIREDGGWKILQESASD